MLVNKEIKERIEKLSLNEKYILAINTSNLEEQKVLMNDVNTNVRTNLAKNKKVHSNIINELLFDCTENVVYAASKNSNITKKRVLREDCYNNKCVLCDPGVCYEKCNSSCDKGF